MHFLKLYKKNVYTFSLLLNLKVNSFCLMSTTTFHTVYIDTENNWVI